MATRDRIITFHSFAAVSLSEWEMLLNDPIVNRHMPLADTRYTEASIAEWAAGKDRQWDTNGYGPWAIRIDGKFAGWSGFQKEDYGPDLALVLKPEFFGFGKQVFDALVESRHSLGIDAIYILLPDSRRKLAAIRRLGFIHDGSVEYDGHPFQKYKLQK